MGGDWAGPSSPPAGCQAPVIAFPPHSRAHDVFWVSVCLLSEAKPTFLNSHRCVPAEESRGPSVLQRRAGDPPFSVGEVTLSLQASYFWPFSPLRSSSQLSLPQALAPLKPPSPDPHQASTSPGDFHLRVVSPSPSPSHFAGGPTSELFKVRGEAGEVQM